MNLNFCSLSSGSSGNCYYLGNEFHGVLIDAGITAGSIRKFLKTIGIAIDSIIGVLVTHNHWDHIKGLEVLTRKNNIPIYTTANIWESIRSTPRQQQMTSDRFSKIPLQKTFHLAGFDIEAFPVFHDAPETIGFHFTYDTRKVTLVTDLGHICQTVRPYIHEANLLIIESNYDEHMLINGSYPSYLKGRILSDNGHLSNHQTATFLAEVMHEKLSHICLAHLSKNNNTPEKALQTLKESLVSKNILQHAQPKIVVLNRNLPSEMIRLNG